MKRFIFLNAAQFFYHLQKKIHQYDKVPYFQHISPRYKIVRFGWMNSLKLSNYLLSLV